MRFHMFIPLGGTVLYLPGGVSAYSCINIGVIAFQRPFPVKEPLEIAYHMCQHVQINVIEVVKSSTFVIRTAAEVNHAS